MKKYKNTFWGRIKEMFGRISPSNIFQNQTLNYYNVIMSSEISVDYSKVNYTLTKAIYYASTMTDENGEDYGDDFLLGAVFGKPIINALVSFTLPGGITIDMPEGDNDVQQELNTFLSDNTELWNKFTRNGFRDGDSYLYMNDDGTMQLLKPESVDKLVDQNDGEKVLGYDITTNVKNDDGTTTKYLLEIRRDKNDSVTEMLYEVASEDNKKLIRETNYENAPFKIVHYANEREAGYVYGFSEYQNVFYLMRNYHAILEQAIKGNIFNNTPLPTVTGVTNVEKFFSKNMTTDDNGNQVIDWKPNKMLVGGKDVNFGVLSAPDNTQGTERLLNILFWQICQTSETPEFVFGTAVQSSKASVSEQTPVMVKKALRKQNDLIPVFQEIIELYIWTQSQLQNELYKGLDWAKTDYKVIMPDITSDDLSLNLEIVKTLLAEGTITKSTALKMLKVDKYLEDIDSEIENAQKEFDGKVEKGTIYPPVNTNQMNKENVDEETPEKNPEDNLPLETT